MWSFQWRQFTKNGPKSGSLTKQLDAGPEDLENRNNTQRSELCEATRTSKREQTRLSNTKLGNFVFEVRLFIIRQSMNFGFWNFFLVQIIADYVNFHMTTYHTYIWNHAGWHRSVLNMTHFQLFAWFGQTLLVRKMGKKSKFLLGDTIGSKFNFKWSSWFWTMSSYQNLRSI
jgi:hypothetical protein